MAALATTIITSAIYDFLKWLLTEAPEKDHFEKALRESFWNANYRLSKEPGVWAELANWKRGRLLNSLTGCLQSPGIDRDEFLRVLDEELKKEGLSREEAERFYSMIFEEFNSIADKEAVKKPEVFQAMMLHRCEEHGVRLKDIADNLNALRQQIPNTVNIVLLVSEALKPQLDRIEEAVTRTSEETRVIVPTIRSVLRRNDPRVSEGTFFRKEPTWVDFKQGFIVERKQVDEIVEKMKKCRIHLVVGEPASGKSVVLKNVGFKLAKRNPHVYYVGIKTESDKLESYFEQVLRIKKGRPVLIIDDAHLQIPICERLIRELRSTKSIVKMLIGSRPIEEVVRKSPRECSEFEYLSRTTLNAEDASRGIIDLFLRKKHGFNKDRAAKASRMLSKYRHDLWILSWVLNAFDPKSNSVDEKQIIEKTRDSIRGLGEGADDALFPISNFYQYEIPFDRSYLTEKIGLEERVINRLVEQSEISQIEQVGEQRSLCLAHSSVANLYLRTYQNYPSLGENAKKRFPGDDTEYEVFFGYIIESDPTYSLNIVYRLMQAHVLAQKRRLLLKLLENKEIENQIHKGIEKEKDLDKITNLLPSCGNLGMNRKLSTCILHEGFVDAVWPKLASETNIRKMNSFFIELFLARHFTRGPARRNISKMTSILDPHVLVPKIEKEKNVSVIDECIMCIRAFDRKFARVLIQSLDLDNLSSKVAGALKEDDAHTAFDTIRNVTDLDQEAGLYLAKRVDFSIVKDKKDLESLRANLWDFSHGLRARKRLRQVILESNPRLEKDMNEVRHEMIERLNKTYREVEEGWNTLQKIAINVKPFVEELRREGITGKELQEKVDQWLRKHEEHLEVKHEEYPEVIIHDKEIRYRLYFGKKTKKHRSKDQFLLEDQGHL